MTHFFTYDFGTGRDGGSVVKRIRTGTVMMILAQPREGKGGIAKPMAVEASKERQVIVFDYNGEWWGNVTKMNPYAQAPDCMVGARHFSNFTFYLSDFDNAHDYLSLGFKSDHTHFLLTLIRDAFPYHENNIARFMELLAALPVGESHGEVFAYNKRFGTKLIAPINSNSKTSLINHFERIKHWFHQGKEEKRVVFDWAKEAARSHHMIIEYAGWRDEKNGVRARSFASKILERIRPLFQKENRPLIYRELRPWIVVEEAKNLAPNAVYQIRTMPGCLVQLHALATQDPKQGPNLVLLAQSPDQLHPMITEGRMVRVVGRMQRCSDSALRSVSERIRAFRREFAFVDDGGDVEFAKFFEPKIACCVVETEA